jgi:PAS domain-containing protein
MKPGITIALTALVALVLARVAAGEPVSQLKPTGYVNDFTHVLDGPSIAQLVVGHDITEQKKAEQALRETERGYRSMVEDAVIGIFQSTGTAFCPAKVRWSEEISTSINRPSFSRCFQVPGFRKLLRALAASASSRGTSSGGRISVIRMVRNSWRE